MSRHTTAPAPLMLQALLGLCAQLQSTAHGARRELVDSFGQMHGMGANAVYQHLKRWAGYDSGRKPRSDAGKSCMSKDTLNTIAAMKAEGTRQNNKATLPTAVAMDILHANGQALPVSVSQVDRLMRNALTDRRSQQAARTFTSLRSKHPNHVHLVDPSLCLVYYMGGKQHAMRDDEFYKNKLEKIATIKLKVWRYVRVDHASGVVDVLYIEAKGESQANMFNFLLHTWGKVDGRVNHGVPKMLLWDKGSANTAAGIKQFLEAMDVEHMTHAAGHAWAKGAVEVANNIVETQFESRLRIEPVDTVEQLNTACGRWLAAFNAGQLKYANCLLSRPGCAPVVRNDLWALIQTSQLTALPDRSLCEWFMSGKEVMRQVDSHLRVMFKHPKALRTAVYDLSAWGREVSPKDMVKVTPLLMGTDFEVRCELQRRGLNGNTPLVMVLAPVSEFDEFGKPLSAQIIGEGYSRAFDSPAMQAQKELRQAAWGTSDEAAVDKKRRANARPFTTVDAETGEVTGLVAHSYIGQANAHDQQSKVAYLPKRAQAMDNAALDTARAGRDYEMPRVSLLEAAKTLRRELGAAYVPAVYGWLHSAFDAAGVPADQMDTLADAWAEHVAALPPEPTAAKVMYG